MTPNTLPRTTAGRPVTRRSWRSRCSARGTIGPAVAAGIFSDIWVYIVATIVGGVLAGVLYKYYLEEA